MPMLDAFMRMRVLVRAVSIPCERVLMTMMRVVDVRMVVVDGFVDVRVFVALRNVQPHANSHEQTCASQTDREAVVVQE